MDRNLFKRKSIDWDDWLGDGPGQPGQYDQLQQAAPVQPLSQQPARVATRQGVTVPAASARRVAPSPRQYASQSAQAAPVPVRPPVPAPRQQPASMPHSWREALSSAAVAVPQQQPVASAVQQPSAPQQMPVHVRRSAPVIPVASPVQQPSSPSAQRGASDQPLQPAQLTPRQPAPVPMSQRPAVQPVAVATMAPGAMAAPSRQPMPARSQPAENPGQSYVQTAQSDAHNAAESWPSESYDNVSIFGPRRSLRSRLARSVAWFGAAATAFGISFGAAVLPAYLHNSKTTEQVTAAVADQEPSTAASSSGSSADGSQSTLQITSGGPTGISLTSSNGNESNKPGYTSTQVTHNGHAVTIEREYLPQVYNGDPSAVKGFAEKLGAVTPVQTSNWGTVYLVSLQDGRQLAALASSRYLVAMTTPGTMDVSDWRTVIDSYQP